jgi:hypothetical protein
MKAWELEQPLLINTRTSAALTPTWELLLMNAYHFYFHFADQAL